MTHRFLLLLFALLSIIAWGGNIQIQLRDCNYGVSIEDIDVQLKYRGKIVLVGKTNEAGSVTIHDQKEANYTVLVSDRSGNFMDREVSVNTKKGAFVEIYLYPTQKLLDAITQEEDEMYGSLEEYAAIVDLGDVNGCSFDDLTETEFPNGAVAMQQFISTHVDYPYESILLGEQGRVYAKFIVEPDGTLTHIRIERGVSEYLDAEAMRLIRSMHKWTPAKCKGVPMRMGARFPINFTFK